MPRGLRKGWTRWFYKSIHVFERIGVKNGAEKYLIIVENSLKTGFQWVVKKKFNIF